MEIKRGLVSRCSIGSPVVLMVGAVVSRLAKLINDRLGLGCFCWLLIISCFLDAWYVNGIVASNRLYWLIAVGSLFVPVGRSSYITTPFDYGELAQFSAMHSSTIV
jgi:uncharacterized membrane protein YczE